MRKFKAITLTITALMTANYGESLGNISNIQKDFRGKKPYGMRTKESLKNAIMNQASMYDDLETEIFKGVTMKKVRDDITAGNRRSLEGGYLNTSDIAAKRTSTILLSDAVSGDQLINGTRFNNNMQLAETQAKATGLNIQKNGKDVGLMPYQYEYDRGLKTYSVTILLDKIGKDENFDTEASNEEKANRVNSILTAIENLYLLVKGSLDNAEPLFAVGGLSYRPTHVFDTLVHVKEGKLEINQALKERIGDQYKCALLPAGNFVNEDEITEELHPISMPEFFDTLRKEVNEYYGI